jgi:hypothetical protein
MKKTIYTLIVMIAVASVLQACEGSHKTCAAYDSLNVENTK